MSQLEISNFTVTFRSDKERTYGGFEMYVTCFRPAEANKEGINNYLTGICSAVHTILQVAFSYHFFFGHCGVIPLTHGQCAHGVECAHGIECAAVL